MADQPVYIADYDSRWSDCFESLRDQIVGVLGALAVQIEHVGSTAVPALAAKPVIDIDVVVGSMADLPSVAAKLRPLGYQPQGDLGVAGREAFTTPEGAPPHHLYVCAVDSPELARHIAFRDFLRAHPDAARDYAELKRCLASRFRNDRTAYTEAKTTFIEHVLATIASDSTPRDHVPE